MLPKGFFVILMAFSDPIDLPNSRQKGLCEKLHTSFQKKYLAFGSKRIN